MVSNRVMYATAAAIAIAAPAEGLRQVAYRDPAGVITVCYGETNNVRSRQYSIDECKALLSASMLKAVETVEYCQPGLPVHVLAAFGDAVYNLGPTIACDPKRSTAARLLAAGQYADACMQLSRWNNARIAGVMVALPGLTKRRNREMQLCMRGLV